MLVPDPPSEDKCSEGPWSDHAHCDSFGPASFTCNESSVSFDNPVVPVAWLLVGLHRILVGLHRVGLHLVGLHRGGEIDRPVGLVGRVSLALSARKEVDRGDR